MTDKMYEKLEKVYFKLCDDMIEKGVKLDDAKALSILINECKMSTEYCLEDTVLEEIREEKKTHERPLIMPIVLSVMVSVGITILFRLITGW